MTVGRQEIGPCQDPVRQVLIHLNFRYFQVERQVADCTQLDNMHGILDSKCSHVPPNKMSRTLQRHTITLGQ